MAVVTTRAVSAGEELLLSYGHEYWVTRGSDDADVAAAAAAVVQRARAAIQQADPGCWPRAPRGRSRASERRHRYSEL